MIKEVLASPYSALAEVYDGMMEHVEYGRWADFVDSVFHRHGRSIQCVCELACGTGTMAVELARRGYDVTGSDASPSMIDAARRKSKHEGIELNLHVSDMRRFADSRSFDAVLCLYDSVNYLLHEAEIRELLENTQRLLTTRGLFIFDVCTEANSLEHFHQRYERDSRHDYVRRSTYDRSERIQVNEVMLRRKGRWFKEVHRQRIYPLTFWEALIAQSPFLLVASYDNLGFGAASESSERVHYILQKVSDA